jgi:glycosyltransferase involved in cell wall biosynthesis
VTRTGARLVLDARMATDGGIGTYLQNVFPRVASARPDWSFTVLGDPATIQALGWRAIPNVAVRQCRSTYYTMSEQIELPLRAPRNMDLFWSPHYNVPVVAAAPLVVTVHDTCHLALQESTRGPLPRMYASFMYRRINRHARAILFDSEFTRNEMRRLLGEPRGRSTVAHLGVDADWWQNQATTPERPLAGPYLVYVGALKRHKNVPALLRAFARIRDRVPHRLVIVGRAAGLNVDPAIAGEAALLGDRVILAGEVNATRLRQYVTHAEALVTASLYEGFGLPPLEAMAAGRPCMVSAAGSLPEVCGDAALYCDPRDETSIAQRLLEVATDKELQCALVRRGHERVRQFNWLRCADTTIDVLERALGARR